LGDGFLIEIAQMPAPLVMPLLRDYRFSKREEK
jgi:hypothetical protein